MDEHDLPPLDHDVAQLLRAEKRRALGAQLSKSRVLDRLEAALGPLDGGGHGGDNGGGNGHGGGSPAGGDGHGSPGGPAPDGGGLAEASTAIGALGAKGVVATMASKPLAVLLGGFLAGGVFGATVHAGYTAGASPEPAAQAAPASASAAQAASPRASAASPPAASSEGPPPAASSSARAPAARSAEASASQRDAVLAAESALVEMARTAIARGQPQAAIEALRRHAAQFPQGRLREEREALLVQALASAGRGAEASERAERLRRENPSSLLLPVLDQALSKKSLTDGGATPQSPGVGGQAQSADPKPSGP